MSARPSTARTSVVDKGPVAEPGSTGKRTTMSRLGQSLASKLNKPGVGGVSSAKAPTEEASIRQSIVEAAEPQEDEVPQRNRAPAY